MRAAIVPALVVLIISVLGTAAQAADQCLTKTEARALYRTSYLYWHGQGGKRCWSSSSRRDGRSGPHQPSRQAVVVPRLPPPPLALPAGLMPPLLASVPLEKINMALPAERELTILDSPRWAWVAAARAAAREEDFPILVISGTVPVITGETQVFSTFPLGAEPDVWPRLPEPANIAGMIIIVMSGLLATAFGLGLWRWQLGRVRVTQ